MSIKQKLLIGFTLLITSTMAIGLFASFRLGQLNNVSMQTANYWMPSIHYLSEVNFFSAGYRRAEYEHILEQTPEDMEKMEKKMSSRSEKMLKALAQYESLIQNDENKKMHDTIKAAWTSYLKESQEVTKLSREGKKVEALRHMRNESNKAYDIVTENLDKQIELSNEGGKKSSISGMETFKSSQLLIYSVLFGLLLGGIFLSSYLVKGIQATIQETLGQVSKIADQVMDISGKLSDASQELSASTNQQASAVQETASSSEEMTAMVNKTAENANFAQQITNQCLSAADQGKRSVEEMARAIQDISASNEDISRQVEQNNRDLNTIVSMINEINDKTKIINDIVFQTKLLSFNASVEAARAGESGKGFAVVAEEVGNLADMSGKAAQDISKLLETSVQKVSQVAQDSQSKVSAILKQGKDKVEAGVRVVRSCENNLNQIVETSHSSLGRVTEINEASSQQSIGIQEIGKAIQELSMGIQQTAHTSQNVSLSATELKEYTNSLRQLVRELSNEKKNS